MLKNLDFKAFLSFNEKVYEKADYSNFYKRKVQTCQVHYLSLLDCSLGNFEKICFTLLIFILEPVFLYRKMIIKIMINNKLAAKF